MSETDGLLAAARECAQEDLEGHALRRYRKLDELLSNGQGSLPEAWIESSTSEERVLALASQLEQDAKTGEYKGGSYAASVLVDVARRIRRSVRGIS